MADDQPPAALTVDLELFGHTPAYRSAAGTTDRDAVGRAGVEFLLEAFAERGARATWFTVGDLADSHPTLVESVAAAGHEIGSHTRTHRLLSSLTPDERRRELVESRERLTAVTGEPVRGVRAPAFDVPAGHFGAAAAAGYDYDASVVPSRTVPGWYGGEFDRVTPGPASAVESRAPDDLTVVPTSVMPGLRLPLTGTWLRFFGPRYTALGMRWLARRGVAPVLYVHPWELVDLPAVEGVPQRVYYHTGAWMRRAVRRLLDQSFEFVPVSALPAVDERSVAAASPGSGAEPGAGAPGPTGGEP